MTQFKFEITAPFAFTLIASVDGFGLIHQIECAAVLSVDDYLRLQRAVWFVTMINQTRREQGSLLDDALKALGRHEYFAVERSILKPLADLEMKLVPTFKGSAA